MRFPRIRDLFALVSFATVPLLVHCSSMSCTEVGCTDGASIEVDFPAPAAATRLHFEACRNDVCSSTSTDAGNAASPASSAQQSCGLDPRGAPYCNYSLGSDGRLHVQMLISAAYSKDHSILRNGDVYRVRVTAADTGAPLAEVQEAVNYTKSQPNGADCDRDYYCQTTTITKSL
jgi:hypothetical protein